MGIFDNLKSEGMEQSEDRLGGFNILDSDAYDGTIMAAFQIVADSGARAIHLNLDFKGKPYSETIYITNKKGENFYTTDAGKKSQLPGFITIDELCLVTTEKPLAEQDTEEKMCNVYDKTAGREIPKNVPMLVELIGKDVCLGILKTKKFKQTETSPGVYVDTDETREENTINKVFHPEYKVTVPEARAGITTPDFYHKWVEKNKGNVINKTTDKASAPKASGGGSAPTSGKPTSSLFGKK